MSWKDIFPKDNRYWESENGILYCGGCLDVLKMFPDESINCIVTSPPYWALRDYGVDGQLGLEPTFQEYINKLCDIFDEIKRILRRDGTCWVNLGDTYFATRWTGRGKGQLMNKYRDGYRDINPQKITGMPDKTLVQIPFRFSIEMVNRGWILRNVIIWHKPNYMPSSVKDRFTVDFEYVFFFVKDKKYWFEQQLEPYDKPMNRWGGDRLKVKGKSDWDENVGQATYRDMRPNPQGKNKRCVWTIPAKPFRGAHFSVYPEKLVEPMIKAGCPKWVCSRCGKPYIRIVKFRQDINYWDDNYWWSFLLGTSHSNRPYKEAFKIMKEWMTNNNCYDYEKFYGWWCKQKSGKWNSGNLYRGQANKLCGELPFPRPEKRLSVQSSSWVPKCGCEPAHSPGIVLDPFIGSGTTAIVASKFSRNYIGIDLNENYLRMVEKRIKAEADQIKLDL